MTNAKFIIIMQHLNSSSFKEALKYLDQQELQLIAKGGYDFSDSEPQQSSVLKVTAPSREISLNRRHAVSQKIMQQEIQFLKNELVRQRKASELRVEQSKAKYEGLINNLNNQVKLARARQQETQSNIPLIKQAIVQVRDMLAGLVPQNVYLRLRDIPERDLPPCQWLLVNVWELISPYKRQVQNNLRECSRLREEVSELSSNNQRLIGQLQHYSRLLCSKEDDYKRHMLNFQNSRKTMQVQIQSYQEQIMLLKEKGFTYDQLMRQFKFVSQEKELLEDKIKIISGFNVKRTPQSPDALTMGDLHRNIEMLSIDKQQLTKENIGLIERNKRLEQRIQLYEKELNEAKASNQKYLNRLLDAKQQASQEVQRKIHQELKELAARKDHQLQITKITIIDKYESQLKFLKDIKEQVQAKCRTLEEQLSLVRRENERFIVQNRKNLQNYDIDQSKLNTTLKIKSEELDKLRALYQLLLNQQNQSKIQNNRLIKQLDIAKSELFKIQAEERQASAMVKAQLAAAREKLALYQKLQIDMDQAIVSIVKGNSDDRKLSLQTLISVPSASQRRVLHAVRLAESLAQKSNECQQAQERVKQLRGREQRLREQLKMSERRAERAGEPQQVLLRAMQEKDNQILQLKLMLKAFRQKQVQMQQDQESIKKQLSLAKNDAHNLLMAKSNFEGLQSMMVNILNKNLPVDSIVPAVQMIEPREEAVREKVPDWAKKLKRRE